MRELIRKFTCGHPKQMIKPVFWITLENLLIIFPAIATFFAINLIVLAFNGEINFQTLWILAAVLAGLFLIQSIVSIASFWNTFHPASIHSAENKTAFIHKIRELPLGYFLNKKSGELINTFTGDFTAIEQSMVGMFTGIFSVVFSCIMTAICFFIFNPIMALAFYISMPIAVLMILLSMKLTGRLSNQTIEAKDKAATYLNEYLHGMKILKSYNQTGKGFIKLKDAYENLVKVSLHGEAVGGTLINGASTVVNIGLPLMCFVGAYLILGGKLGIAEYLSLIIIGTKIMAPIITWVRYMVVIRVHYSSATRIDNVMMEKSMKGERTATPSSDIVFEHVSFAYNGRKEDLVLKDVSFAIPKGKLTAIVGPSGGGKSTILRLIARFWDTTSGEISCGDTPLSEINVEKWMQNISMVLQDVYLFHETVRENLIFGRKDISEEEVIAACKQAQCHDFIMSLPQGYNTVIGEGGSTLSGGEKQRISIARAILKKSPILLLDEPTSSLDAKNEILVQRAINELVKNKTVVMIAHRLKTVQNANQILVINNGEIEEAGTHQELLEQKRLYAKLWTMQQDALNWRFKTKEGSVIL